MPNPSSAVWPCKACGADCPGGDALENGINAECLKCGAITFHPWKAAALEQENKEPDGDDS
jgi:hypothetical protein